MNNKHCEFVSECFRNYKEAVLEQAKHPDDEDYDNWVVHTETQLDIHTGIRSIEHIVIKSAPICPYEIAP